MASAVDSLVIGRAVCRRFPSAAPICRPRCLSTLASPRVAIRVLISRTLVRPCHAISLRHASSSTSKAVSPDDMIKLADKNLMRVLESVVTCADYHLATQQEVALPEDSPFEIVDDPGGPSIILKREFQGEKVEVRVFMNLDDEDADDDDNDEDKNASGDAQPSLSQPSASLVVTINRGDGPDLQFCCCMDSERLEIERMTLRGPGEVDNGVTYGWPAFSRLHVVLQKALHNCLVARGIKPSLYDFLSDYLANREASEFAIWSKKLTEFAAKGVVTR